MSVHLGNATKNKLRDRVKACFHHEAALPRFPTYGRQLYEWSHDQKLADAFNYLEETAMLTTPRNVTQNYMFMHPSGPGRRFEYTSLLVPGATPELVVTDTAVRLNIDCASHLQIPRKIPALIRDPAVCDWALAIHNTMLRRDVYQTYLQYILRRIATRGQLAMVWPNMAQQLWGNSTIPTSIPKNWSRTVKQLGGAENFNKIKAQIDTEFLNAEFHVKAFRGERRYFVDTVYYRHPKFKVRIVFTEHGYFR